MIFSRSIILSAAVLLTSQLVSDAHADVLVQLTSDLFGNTTGTVTGTFDVTAGLNSGATGGSADRVFRAGSGSLGFQRRTTPATFNNTRLFTPDPGNIGPIFSTFTGEATQFSIDDIYLRLTPGTGPISSAFITGYDGNTTGTFNESFTYTIPFSSFNAGTWDWGSFGGAANDGIRLEISAVAVPEPTSCAVLAMGLACVTLRRRRSA